MASVAKYISPIVQVVGLAAAVPVRAGSVCMAPEASNVPVYVLSPVTVWLPLSMATLEVSLKSDNAG